MTENINTTGSEFNAVEGANVPDQAIVGKRTFTKEERIAKIDAQIEVLTTKRQSIIDGTEQRTTAAKIVVLPEVGTVVSFKYGRTTATTAPSILTGTVFAVKAAADVDGKRTPAIIKVLVGEGAEAEFITVYPAQIVVPEAAPEEAAE